MYSQREDLVTLAAAPATKLKKSKRKRKKIKVAALSWLLANRMNTRGLWPPQQEEDQPYCAVVVVESERRRLCWTHGLEAGLFRLWLAPLVRSFFFTRSTSSMQIVAECSASSLSFLLASAGYVLTSAAKRVNWAQAWCLSQAPFA